MALGGQHVPLERHVGGGDPRRQALRRAERVEARRVRVGARARRRRGRQAADQARVDRGRDRLRDRVGRVRPRVRARALVVHGQAARDLPEARALPRRRGALQGRRGRVHQRVQAARGDRHVRPPAGVGGRDARRRHVRPVGRARRVRRAGARGGGRARLRARGGALPARLQARARARHVSGGRDVARGARAHAAPPAAQALRGLGRVLAGAGAAGYGRLQGQ